MPDPVRTAAGDLVEPVDLFAADDPAQPLQGGDVPGRPIRTADGALVKRVAPYEVQAGVAVPVTKLGSDVGTDLTADPPLQMTDTGDGTGVISIDTDVAGGVPTLDQNILIRLAQMPISGLNYHGAWDATTNTPTLADGVGTAGDFYRVSVAGTQDLGSGPIIFEVGDHVIYEGTTWQQLDPAQVIDWGDIQGTLANQSDLNTALGAKADSANVPTSANPSAQVGLTAVNGSAATYLRSDGAPALDQGMSPAWTGAHDFTGGTIAVATPTTDPQAAPKGYVDSQVATASGSAAWGGITGTLANQTDLTTALGAKADQSALTAHTSNTSNPHIVTKAQVGLGNVDNTSDANKPISTATQAALDDKLGLAGGTMFGAIHMGEQKVVNLGDGAAPRDAVNLQQLDVKADASDLTSHEAQQGVAGVHLPAGGTSGQVPTRGTGSTVAWTDPPSAPVQSVNGNTGAVVLAAGDVGAVPAADEGQANGVATLDGSGKVPAAQLNVSGGFNYLGSWDASTNTPTLADASGSNGDMYKVSVAGSQDLGSGTVAYEVGDHVVYVAGTLNRWDRFAASEAVSSVAGKTGVVTLVKADVGLDQVDNTLDTAKPVSTAQQAALDTKLNLAGGTMSGTIDMGTNKAINLGTPTGPADAATKTYVDNHAAGGTAAWGGITGTLSAQTDLAQALGGKVDDTDKATQAAAEAGTDDTRWMTPLGTAQAIAAHQQSVPETYTAFTTTDSSTSDPTNFTDALIGQTPGNDDSWQADWLLYISAAASGTVEFAVAAQTGLTFLTGGFGALTGAGDGVVASVDSTSLIFLVDTSIRLIRLTTYVSAATTGTFFPVRLTVRSPDSVAVTVHTGSHVVATKLLTAT